MKMDTVWQAKVADSAIKSEQLRHLDVAGAESRLDNGLGPAVGVDSNQPNSFSFFLSGPNLL